MFDESTEVIPGLVVVHNEGLRYQVEDIRRSTNDYEAVCELGGRVVNYTQLEAGSFPAGTKWSKDEAGFRQFFTPIASGGKPNKSLVITPLFYDVLSGEFCPTSDEKTHTLGRLAVACIQKGQVIDVIERGDSVTTISEYSPSWSSDVTAQTQIDEKIDTGDQNIRLKSFQLTRGESQSLSVLEIEISSGVRAMVMGNGIGLREGALDLENVAYIRSLVTDQAQCFFDAKSLGSNDLTK